MDWKKKLDTKKDTNPRMEACLAQMPRVLNSNITGGGSVADRSQKKLTESYSAYAYRKTDPVNKDLHLKKDAVKQ